MIIDCHCHHSPFICWTRRYGGLAHARCCSDLTDPALHPGVELAKIHALDLPPEDEALVLGGNFLQLISRRRHRPQAHRATCAAAGSAADRAS
jgi:hypothetical protein